MILPIWQPLFSSSHQIAKAIGEGRGEPATHTGTLDPMAQGILVVLTGEDRFLKGKLEWPKTYEFEILWGIQTDSGDQLGIISDISIKKMNEEKLAAVLQEFPKAYTQKIPNFSAQRWQGKSAFDFAKAGHAIAQRTRVVHIEDLKHTKTLALSLSEVLRIQQNNVSQVQGNFRQAEILLNWKEQLCELPENTEFVVTSHSVVTSPGTYIRQLVQDFAEQIGVPATTWSITRTKNGPYDREKTHSHIQ